MKNLEKKIDLKKASSKILKLQENLEICKKEGHEEKNHYISSNINGVKVYANCSRCNTFYSRDLTKEEKERFYNQAKIPLV